MLQFKKFFTLCALTPMLACTLQAGQPDVSYTKCAVNTLEQTVTALKNNPKSLEKIDALVDASKEDIVTSVNNIINQIPEETRKETEKIVKEEVNDAIKSLKALFKNHSKKIEARVAKTLGEENIEMVTQEVTVCVEKIDANLSAPDINAAIEPLVQDLQKNAAIEPIVQDLQKNIANICSIESDI